MDLASGNQYNRHGTDFHLLPCQNALNSAPDEDALSTGTSVEPPARPNPITAYASLEFAMQVDSDMGGKQNTITIKHMGLRKSRTTEKVYKTSTMCFEQNPILCFG